MAGGAWRHQPLAFVWRRVVHHTKIKLANPRCIGKNLTCAPHQSDSDRCESKYDLKNVILTTKNTTFKTIGAMFRENTPQRSFLNQVASRTMAPRTCTLCSRSSSVSDLAGSTQFLQVKMRIVLCSRSCSVSDLAPSTQFLQVKMRIAIVL